MATNKLYNIFRFGIIILVSIFILQWYLTGWFVPTTINELIRRSKHAENGELIFNNFVTSREFDQKMILKFRNGKS